MSVSSAKILCTVGLLALLHSAYSAAQHRAYLRLINEEFISLPADILVQTLLSLFITCYAATQIAGVFQPIRTDLKQRTKSWDSIGNCPSFYTFNHRGQSLSPFFVSENIVQRPSQARQPIQQESTEESESEE